MRVSEHVESALHTCVLLAAAPEGAALPVRQLAAFHELPAASLAKQLQALAAAGLVSGSAGRTGGYALARPASAIRVLEVVEAVDGREPGFRCREIRRRGPCTGARRRYSPRCAIAAAMDAAEDAWRQSLAQVSLVDLTRRVSAQLDSRTRSQTASWLTEHRRAMR
jgi:Rrf2 family protein